MSLFKVNHHSGGGSYTNVITTDQAIAALRKLETLETTYKQTNDGLRNAARQSAKYWDGPAHTDFVNRIEKDYQTFEKFNDLLESYRTTLRKIIEQYRTTEAENRKIVAR